MQVIREKIGDTDVLIQSLDVDILGAPIDEYGTETTSIKPSQIVEIYERARSVIREIAEKASADLKSLHEIPTPPSKMEMEFNLGFSVEGNAWVLTTSGSGSLTIKLIWEKEQSNEK